MPFDKVDRNKELLPCLALPLAQNLKLNVMLKFFFLVDLATPVVRGGNSKCGLIQQQKLLEELSEIEENLTNDESTVIMS